MLSRRVFLVSSLSVASLGLGLVRPGRAQTAAFDFSGPSPDGNFSWTKSRFAWEFSQLAYSSAGQLQHSAQPPTGIPLTQIASLEPVDLALNDTQALVWHRADCAIIAFRGTEGNRIMDAVATKRYRAEVRDALTDARYGLSHLQSHPDVGVHSGFREAVDKCWSWIQGIQATGKPTLFIGHSLGGALATYAAMRTFWEDRKVSAVYTFASPRVGNPRWAKLYNDALGAVTFRFANKDDLVTRLPFRGLNPASVASMPASIRNQLLKVLPPYRHVGQPITFLPEPSQDWNGLLTSVPVNWASVKQFFASSVVPHLRYEPGLELGLSSYSSFMPHLAVEADPTGLQQTLTGILDNTAAAATGTRPSSNAERLAAMRAVGNLVRSDPSRVRQVILQSSKD